MATRFCRYVRVHTTSDPASDSVPSTARQLDLQRILVDELLAIGLSDAVLDANGYVLATLPGVLDTPPSPIPSATLAAGTQPPSPGADPIGAGQAHPPIVGLVAHVDTSPDAPGENVRPLIHARYDGGVIQLPGAPDAMLDPARQPTLREHVGHDLITSDGSTLLGSDDKAGVAIIMQLAEDLLAADRAARERGEAPAPRATLRLLFTPDEEIGRGVDHLDLAAFGADVAYTVDGGGTDRLNVETFNAAEAVVTIEGVGVHPGYAKDVMVNAGRLAARFIEMLPADEAPETTAGREGYLHPHTVTATAERAEIRILIRDFEEAGMERRRALLRDIAGRVQADNPKARVTVEIKESYRNMLRYIEEKDRRVIDVALTAGRAMGFEPELEPVRGGTDGARLSERGIPTPNIFTGGHDFHSRFEWNTVQNLERALAYVKQVVHEWGAVES